MNGYVDHLDLLWPAFVKSNSMHAAMIAVATTVKTLNVSMSLNLGVATNSLSLPSILDKCRSSAVTYYRPTVGRKSRGKTGHGQEPKHHTERQGEAPLDCGWLVLQVKRQNNRYRHDGHVGREPKPRQKGCHISICSPMQPMKTHSFRWRSDLVRRMTRCRRVRLPEEAILQSRFLHSRFSWDHIRMQDAIQYSVVILFD
jgi:hypothetical protein